MATLTVLMGPPGAGKTTWLQANQRPGQVVCSTERLRTDRTLGDPGIVAYMRALRTKATRALNAGHAVTVDGCHTRRSRRTLWLHIAHDHHAQLGLVVFHTPLAVLLAVQRQRTHGADEPRARAYHAEHTAALHQVTGEGWARIDHVHRGEDVADRGHNGAAWRSMRRTILAQDPLVCFCGQPIDRRLRWPDRWSATVDLIVPHADGGDPLDAANLRPAHLHCNSARGAGRSQSVARCWTTTDQP